MSENSNRCDWMTGYFEVISTPEVPQNVRTTNLWVACKYFLDPNLMKVTLALLNLNVEHLIEKLEIKVF